MKKQGKQNINSNDFRPARATYSTRSACPAGRTASAHYFRTVWKVDAGDAIEFNTWGSHTIDWGDGTVEQVKDNLNKHTYVKKGEYTVSIGPGVTAFLLNEESAHKLIEIKQWGTAQWETMKEMFWGAGNMVCTATDKPDLSKVEDMGDMFYKCSKFNSPIEHWDTKRVKYMQSMLSRALMFNRSLANMDISSLKYTISMLSNTPAFDQDLRDFKPKANTDNMFGWEESLAQYNEQHAERYDAQDEKQDVYSVLNG